MEGEPVLRKASIIQRQVWLHSLDFVSLIGDCFEILESNTLLLNGSRGIQRPTTKNINDLNIKRCAEFQSIFSNNS